MASFRSECPNLVFVSFHARSCFPHLPVTHQRPSVLELDHVFAFDHPNHNPHKTVTWAMTPKGTAPFPEPKTCGPKRLVPSASPVRVGVRAPPPPSGVSGAPGARAALHLHHRRHPHKGRPALPRPPLGEAVGPPPPHPPHRGHRPDRRGLAPARARGEAGIYATVHLSTLFRGVVQLFFWM